MEFLSPRISIERSAEGLSVVISPRLPRWKESLLIAWTLAWTFCGAWFIYELTGTTDVQLRQGLLAMIAFWIYFELRIVRALLWRLKGFELLRVKDGVLTIKDSILGFGKARDHFAANITNLGPLDIDDRSLKWQLNESFWVIGGERLGFEDLGKKVVFGKGLTEEEAKQVAAVVKKALMREQNT